MIVGDEVKVNYFNGITGRIVRINEGTRSGLAVVRLDSGAELTYSMDSLIVWNRTTPAQEATEAAKLEAFRRAEDYRQASGVNILPSDVHKLSDWLEKEFRKARRLDEEDLDGYFLRLARRILTGEWRG